MEIIAEPLLQLVFEILFLPFELLLFESLFGHHSELPSAIPVIKESTDPSQDVERDKRLELYFSRGYW